jgi:hypothetical protein
MPKQSALIFLCFLMVSTCTVLFLHAYQKPEGMNDFNFDSEHSSRFIQFAPIRLYPVDIRTTIIQKFYVKKPPPRNFCFNRPDELNTLKPQDIGIFDPHGLNVRYEQVTPDFMADSKPGTWYFNAEIQIPGVGTEKGDLVAFLPGIKKEVCVKINDELGIPWNPVTMQHIGDNPPRLTRDLSASYKTRLINDGVKDCTQPAGLAPALDASGLKETLTKYYDFGCFQNSTGEYVYYHVLLAR